MEKLVSGAALHRDPVYGQGQFVNPGIQVQLPSGPTKMQMFLEV
ncbi:hypothetical protein HaLaN_25063 [Haematococcus lacustris]|uniref:Uncharacterized protein n=1 Tax=Haematococcus lacustris TaxID=44745 RepID=A0A6A0A3M2_HAELA|nr:hypothetical protein HaLaN_25063 [Haematococcus lacustris]